MPTKELTSLRDVVTLLRCIQQNPEFTYKKMANVLNISESTVKRMRKKVQSLGVVIENTGTKRKPGYKIIEWGVISQNEVTHNKASLLP